MTLDVFNNLCIKNGNSGYSPNERWKSIKYLSVEGIGYPIPIREYFLRNDAYFINNPDIGPGFYIYEFTRADTNIINPRKVVTFIPLSQIIAISFAYKNKSESTDIIVFLAGDSFNREYEYRFIAVDQAEVPPGEDFVIINANK